MKEKFKTINSNDRKIYVYKKDYSTVFEFEKIKWEWCGFNYGDDDYKNFIAFEGDGTLTSWLKDYLKRHRGYFVNAF